MSVTNNTRIQNLGIKEAIIRNINGSMDTSARAAIDKFGARAVIFPI
jgi:hypothetical protein